MTLQPRRIIRNGFAPSCSELDVCNASTDQIRRPLLCERSPNVNAKRREPLLVLGRFEYLTHARLSSWTRARRQVLVQVLVQVRTKNTQLRGSERQIDQAS